MPSTEPNEILSRTLQDWRVSPPRNPAFRAQVWERITTATAALPWRVYVRQHAAVVAGALALAVLAGAIGGREGARAIASADSARLAKAYVQTYDARTLQLLR